MTTELRAWFRVASLLALVLAVWAGHSAVLDAGSVATVHGTVTDGSGEGSRSTRASTSRGGHAGVHERDNREVLGRSCQWPGV